MGAVARPVAQRSSGTASPGRRFVVISRQDDPMLVFAAAGKQAKRPPTVQSFASFIDSLTSLCLCNNPMDRNVIYPVEAFDFPLNHVKLVEQRRRALKHKMFRPVSEDEGSVSSQYIIPKRQKASALGYAENADLGYAGNSAYRREYVSSSSASF